jgi:hypothetical protein
MGPLFQPAEAHGGLRRQEFIDGEDEAGDDLIVSPGLLGDLADPVQDLGRSRSLLPGEIELGWHSTTITTAKKIADALEAQLSDLVADL